MVRLYVGNLDYSMNEEYVRELLGKYGEIESVAMVFDKDTNVFRGFCFVNMEDEGGLKAVEELDGKTFAGRKLEVIAANLKKRRTKKISSNTEHDLENVSMQEEFYDDDERENFEDTPGRDNYKPRNNYNSNYNSDGNSRYSNRKPNSYSKSQQRNNQRPKQRFNSRSNSRYSNYNNSEEFNGENNYRQNKRNSNYNRADNFNHKSNYNSYDNRENNYSSRYNDGNKRATNRRDNSRQDYNNSRQGNSRYNSYNNDNAGNSKSTGKIQHTLSTYQSRDREYRNSLKNNNYYYVDREYTNRPEMTVRGLQQNSYNNSNNPQYKSRYYKDSNGYNSFGDFTKNTLRYNSSSQRNNSGRGNTRPNSRNSNYNSSRSTYRNDRQDY